MAKTGDIVQTTDGHFYRLEHGVSGLAYPDVQWWIVAPLPLPLGFRADPPPADIDIIYRPYTLSVGEFTVVDPFEWMVWKVQHGQS